MDEQGVRWEHYPRAANHAAAWFLARADVVNRPWGRAAEQ